MSAQIIILSEARSRLRPEPVLFCGRDGFWWISELFKLATTTFAFGLFAWWVW